ncbi:MAG: class I tRNA ligase family protein, partial [Candidatus Paceibacterota bacterium]
MKSYDPKKIELKWQKEWDKKKVYQVKDFKKDKFFALIEIPYPSGEGLHIGHPRPYVGMDIIARKRRMEGQNVLYPIGWDAFGLPTENYAIKTGKQPALVSKKNIETFTRQIKSLGISFDWSREINTTDPEYYKWTQWIFLQFFKKGLAYKSKSEINWCPSCKIGLANEEVIDGKCERCGTETIKKEKEQWMLGITKYAERLDQDLDLVDYPERVKLSQRNWIGKSEGSEIEFEIKYSPSPTLPEGKGEMPGYLTADSKSYKLLYESSVEMRKNPTRAEEILWKALKGNSLSPALSKGKGEIKASPFGGGQRGPYHFRQQHIINNFIVDFVCLSKKLVIEVDGDIHDLQKEKDLERTKILEILGFNVIRFKNEEVLKNLGQVIRKIKETLENPSLWEGQGWAEKIKVFTTRADTLFGATYVVLAPEHRLVESLKLKIENKNEVEKYISDVKKKSDLERTENKIKTGVLLKGIKAVNPANGEEISIWIADYVLPHYGTGAVMAVPAHDERDFEFAKKYKLEIKNVIDPVWIADTNKDASWVERNAISVIIKHWSEEKYLCLKWKKANLITFVTGGVETGQTSEQAARAEILEETGFLNLDLIQLLPNSHSKFYHIPKKENRFAHFSNFYFKLKNGEKKEIDESEKEKHEVIWLKPEEIEKLLTPEGQKYDFKTINMNQIAYINYGILINSDNFNNLDSQEAIKKITEFVGGKIVTKFKLRDWVFSRQRYWGEPIPIIHCEKCGEVPVPEKDLPVKLPKVKSYKPTDTGESPLAGISKWVNVQCPKCKGKAKRETDTMPNWAGSSWYYLRYADPKNKKVFADQKKLKYWLGNDPRHGGVNWYNGGMEHTTLHLLYSRFWHKFLYDLKLVPTVE